MRPFPTQKEYKTFKAALNNSIKKWEYFSVCTLEELKRNRLKTWSSCGLCFYHICEFDEKCENNSLSQCKFISKCDLCLRADDIAKKVYDDEKPLSKFHTAAKKVLKELKKLKGK